MFPDAWLLGVSVYFDANDVRLLVGTSTCYTSAESNPALQKQFLRYRRNSRIKAYSTVLTRRLTSISMYGALS